MNHVTVITFITLLFFTTSSFSQGNNKRYLDEVFSTYNLASNIQYGQSIAVNGSAINLMLDIYSPASDIETVRPLIIFIHGGGFKSNDKLSSFGTRVCGGLAKRGYVVASINYRLSSTINDDKQHFEAMVRALQDAKASVRFFRRYAIKYGIDTCQVFVTGSSAGSITALHMAFLDQNEIPSYVDMSSLGGNLEGNSGNSGYSSQIQGVISNWGALGDFRWMKHGDVPVYSVHGTADVTVPHDSSFSDGPFKYGSEIIYQNALNLGIPTGLRLFENTGHTLDNNSSKQDSAVKDFSKWLYTILKNNISLGSIINNGANPESFILYSNYPNPFNPATKIVYDISTSARVKIMIFNILGEVVQTLKNEIQNPGKYEILWNGYSKNGMQVPSGFYFCVLQFGQNFKTLKMLLDR